MSAPAVVVLVGNPRPGSRTRGAAEAVSAQAADRLRLTGDAVTIDLADLAGEVFATERPKVDAALGVVAQAELLVVATPVYKASYTGLLKAFLDLYGPRGLDGVRVLPLVVSAAAAHANAGDDHLLPLLAELGARVPSTTLALLESELPDAAAVAGKWLDAEGWAPSAAEVA